MNCHTLVVVFLFFCSTWFVIDRLCFARDENEHVGFFWRKEDAAGFAFATVDVGGSRNPKRIIKAVVEYFLKLNRSINIEERLSKNHKLRFPQTINLQNLHLQLVSLGLLWFSICTQAFLETLSVSYMPLPTVRRWILHVQRCTMSLCHNL